MLLFLGGSVANRVIFPGKPPNFHFINKSKYMAIRFQDNSYQSPNFGVDGAIPKAP